MYFDYKEILTAGMVLFAVIDIIGSLPVVIDLRRKLGHIQSEKASVVSMIIMIVFLFLGESILSVIGIDVGSFALAGSLIIFFLALEMILGIRLFREEAPATASIVPIAFPLIAGTGTLTTLLSMKAEYQTQNIIVAIMLNTIIVYVVLKSAARIEKFLGAGGISILRKVFGVVLMAIAIKLFKSNWPL